MVNPEVIGDLVLRVKRGTKRGTGCFSRPFLLSAVFVKVDRHRFSLDCAVRTEPIPGGVFEQELVSGLRSVSVPWVKKGDRLLFRAVSPLAADFDFVKGDRHRFSLDCAV